MNLFQRALRRQNTGRPPVWLMRQAGRYHSHYQRLRERHDFIELCRRPRLAAEVTLGPIDDFGFDAAILFSDLLFPLEALGMGLRYEEGPVLGWHLKTASDLGRLGTAAKPGFFDFQGEALKLVRERLGDETGLLGFVGAPLTLYFYATEGSHQKRGPGGFEGALAGFTDGRWDGFCERVLPLLVDEMAVQAAAGADAVAVFDTCAGEVDTILYRERVVPALRRLLNDFAARAPGIPVTYYSKGTGAGHWGALHGLPVACLGIDWQQDLSAVLSTWGAKYAIQGNIDPSWLLLDREEMEWRVRHVFEDVLTLRESEREGWICGLGHGVLPKTPEQNVRAFLRLQREMFR